MQLRGLHHVTAICRDADATIAFYRDLLGLTVVHDGPSDDVDVTALLSGRDVVAIGEPLRLAVDTAHLHFFDPQSGNAVK